MGISLSTARVLAPATFALDFISQMIGMQSKPNMLDVHEKHTAAFTPYAWAIPAWFSPQQILQLFWLRELYRSDAQVERSLVDYVPFFSLGQVCIGLWQFLWNSENLKAANIFVMLNSTAHLYYVYAKRVTRPTTYQQKLTNAVAISFAGIGLLDAVHNTSVAYYPGVAPNTLVKALTTILPPIAALTSPSLMGVSMAYNLFAIAYGQRTLAGKLTNGGGGGEGWSNILGMTGAVCTAAVGLRYFNGDKWL